MRLRDTVALASYPSGCETLQLATASKQGAYWTNTVGGHESLTWTDLRLAEDKILADLSSLFGLLKTCCC